MRLLCATALTLSTLVATQFSHAYTVADVQLRTLIPANDERPELVLNGASLRELYLLVDTYVGALYLEERTNDPESILKSDTHKRMVFHVMMKKVGARRIASALQEALVMNITKEQHKDLTQDIETMLSFFDGRLHKGEESFFDYIPGVGTRVTLNNEVKGIIKGKNFYRALLSIWVGENPVGRRFKQDILGLNWSEYDDTIAGH